MPRIADVLERESRTVDLEHGDFERLLGRRERKQRNRRIRAGALGVIVALAMGILFVRSLTTDPIPADRPVEPAPASGALVYSLRGDIYVADPDGSNAVNIAEGIADAGCTGIGAYWSNEVPSWSPDGRYLAFEHACSTSGQVDLMVTDPHGNVVAEFPRDGWGFEWSPDSTRIAVWGSFGETIDVYGLDGVRQTSLPLPRRMGPPYDSGPGEWLPDGSALLLYGAFVVPVDGSAPLDDTFAGEATYSPDGSRVAVVTGTNTVAVIDADGSPVSEAAVEGVDAWSPDGDRFVTLSHDEISVVDVVSGTVTMLPEARAALNGNKILGIRGFSPQGDRILYEAGDGNGGATGLWSISVDGSDARLVVAGTTQGEWQSR
jgi:Tol biopolymer transport system component